MKWLIDLYFEYYFFTLPLTGVFLVIMFNHKQDEEPTILREDEVEPRAKSWLFGFIRGSSDKEEIIEHGRTEEGDYEIKTRNKYGEETDYYVTEE